MKAVLFVLAASLAGTASAADAVYLTAELARNGETIDKFSALTTDRHPQPHRDVQLIKVRDSVTKGKVNLADLEIGTTSTVTPIITSDGRIRLDLKMDYVRLKKMETATVGKLTIDQPQTDGYKLATTVTLANGERREFRSTEDGDDYVYTVSATIR